MPHLLLNVAKSTSSMEHFKFHLPYGAVFLYENELNGKGLRNVAFVTKCERSQKKFICMF